MDSDWLALSSVPQGLTAPESMDKIDDYIERVQHLPPAPTVMTKLLGLFEEPNRDIDRIVELIGYDPSLTAEVLRRCNSVFFRGAEPASDIFEAVTRLGLNEAYRVVVAMLGARTMSLPNSCKALDASVLWRHSVATAVASATLGRWVGETEAAAFTAGLLHDVGKLVLASVEGQAYGELLQPPGTHGPALARAEEAALGVNHASIGARLLSRWGLPKRVALVVLHHHDSAGAAVPFERLGATVHLANNLAHHLADNPDAPLEANSLDPEAVSLLRLTAQDLVDAMEQTQGGVKRIQGLLRVAA